MSHRHNALTRGVHVTLPIGLFRDGTRHGVAVLRALTGAEERLVQEAAAAGMARAGLISALISASVIAIGTVTPIDEAAVDALSVGDREALTLHLQRITFGEAIQAVVSCPACTEMLDLDLRVSNLLLPQVVAPVEEIEVSFHAEGAPWRARLRRASGADQRAACDAPDPAATLLRKCLRTLMCDGHEVSLDKMSNEVIAALDEALAALDPQADIRLALTCPACGEAFSAPFDAAGHLFAELAAEGDLLLHDVATIARRLHWREADILALPRARRRAYAELAQESVG